MNYGEELVYLYFRLNGFFLIKNFVVHKSEKVEYTSDVDLIGVRFPYVYEEIGGKPDDWDESLLSYFSPHKILGVLCEVKTGSYDESMIFRSQYLEYGIKRFGFIPNISDYLGNVCCNAVADVSEIFQIGKLLVAYEEPKTRKDLLFINISRIREFLRLRIRKYLPDKNRDRMFFPSINLQNLIDEMNNEE